LTLEAGHQIAINDDDYIIVVDAGDLIFRFDGSAWYRHIDARFNDSGSNLLDLTAQYGSHRKYDVDSYTADEGSDYSTANTSFEDVDASDFSLEITTAGGDVMVGLSGGTLDNTIAGTIVYMDVEVDGVRIGGDDGIFGNRITDAGGKEQMSFVHLLFGLTPGTHIFKLQWKVSAGTSVMFAGAATGGGDLHPQFSAREMG